MPYCSNCGVVKTKLDKQSLCKDCRNTLNIDSAHATTTQDSFTPPGENTFWEGMTRLLEVNFIEFEEKL